MNAEFSAAVATFAGNDALAWFLRQPAHVKLLKARVGGIPTYLNPRVRQTLLSSLCEYASTHGDEDGELIRFAVASVTTDLDHLARIEAVKLVALCSDESDDLASVLKNGLALDKFIEAILGIGEEFPLKAEDAGQVVLDALRSLHWDFGDSDDEGTSEISDILLALSEHPVAAIRREANTCLGYVAPFEFVRALAEKIQLQSLHRRESNLGEFSIGIWNAARGLGDCYYGDLCPGSLEAIREDPGSHAAEYEKMRRSLEPIIRVFGGMGGTDTFESILESLGRDLDEAGLTERGPHVDVHTLPLPFEDDGRASAPQSTS
jgi:hypothetical protein